MRNNLTIISSILFSLTFFISCGTLDSEDVSGSGNIVKIEYEFKDFKKVDIGYAFKTKITRGDEYKIIIRVDDNMTEHLRVSSLEGLLSIKLNSDNNYSNIQLEADIIMPDIEFLRLSGASSGAVTGFDFEHRFSANLSGASNFVSTINSGNIALDLSGASNVVLVGIGEDLSLDVSGTSNVEMRTFQVSNANINLSGASRATIFTNGKLNATLSGASSLFYKGEPTMGNINTSGASTIQKL